MDSIQPTRKTDFSDFGAGLTKVLQAVRAVCGVKLNPSLVGADVIQMLYRKGQEECEIYQGIRTLSNKPEIKYMDF